MKGSFYVDDLVTGHKTTQAARELQDKAKERLALGGFNLRKQLTNSDEFREKIQQRGLRDGAKLTDKTKSADESYVKEMLGTKGGSQAVMGLYQRYV